MCTKAHLFWFLKPDYKFEAGIAVDIETIMKKLAVVVAFTLGTSMVNAASVSNFYIGSKLGYSQVDSDCASEFQCDKDSASVGAYLGYQYNDNVAVEYGVDYLGHHTTSKKRSLHFTDVLTTDVLAISLAPKFSYSLTDNLALFTKIGAAYMIAEEENDVVATASAGAEYALTQNLKLRAEYQRFEKMSDIYIEDMSFNNFSFGISYQFGEQNQAVVENVESHQDIVEPKEEVAAAKVELKHEGLTQVIYFGFDSTKVSQESEHKLLEIQKLLENFPQSQVEIVGFTDDRGASQYNEKLAKRRAQSIAKYLESKGVKADQISLTSKGELEPVASNHSEDGRGKNRRVEVSIPEFQIIAQ